jgi:hypothetical protein
MIGALLRVPWEAVQRYMLERLHERGFDDLDAAHLNVFQYPGPQGARPTELAARLRITKQALNYLLGELERLGYVERKPDPDDLRSKKARAHAPRHLGGQGDPRSRGRSGSCVGAAARSEALLRASQAALGAQRAGLKRVGHALSAASRSRLAAGHSFLLS